MKFNLSIIFSVFCTLVSAQDPIFTQYFLVPESLNPSFTGLLETTSAGVIHRSQWTNLNYKIDTDYAYFSTWSENNLSGIGVNFLNHRENFTGYNFLQANINYSYRVELNYEWYFRPGIEIGYGSKSFGFQNLILRDQINLSNETISPVSIDPLQLNNRIHFIDISTGLLFYTDNFWIGSAIKHLNRPNISIAEEGNIPLDMFYNISTGYEFNLSDIIETGFLPYETRMMVTGNFMEQGGYNRLDIGTSIIFSQLVIGATAALNPIKKTDQSHTLTSINLFSGLQYEKFKIGFSYDINTSKIGRTGGVFELGLVYQFDVEARKCFGCPNYN
ncbi:MAG: PorP/SprF family type IX secretion system membrane protein [Flavobacterium sp.]|jgi:type IX secretion system PorP/SprF family membrane protein|uniref:PorP/SprF family type IX secretion system membrane protein n=1 Tax=Flavobacterium sp. TaxID=239 RepID=UPI001B721BBF|nr:PorP/SprF family type IX secretion system membrane protein [Flavobacterium sp.]MBP9848805.1 PorP/SprF family type IX secretion system membrane protein [Flavobacterium sp.]TAF09712.1 MAG: type IX secretion system membrane protein PorP/SprF [Flavobacteriia bacterium]WRH72852.1 MAG: PorP/SprF family type IX secretion system membrane protein [Flavobacterium sp.]